MFVILKHLSAALMLTLTISCHSPTIEYCCQLGHSPVIPIIQSTFASSVILLPLPYCRLLLPALSFPCHSYTIEYCCQLYHSPVIPLLEYCCQLCYSPVIPLL